MPLYHLQTNGQVEQATRLVLGIMPRLVKSWRRPTKSGSNSLTSFCGARASSLMLYVLYTIFMVYDAEPEAELERQNDLDALKEERDVAVSRLAIYQQQLHRYQEREVRTTSFMTMLNIESCCKAVRPWDLSGCIIKRVVSISVSKNGRSNTSFIVSVTFLGIQGLVFCCAVKS
jgi:hypothetical protein